MVGTWLEDRRSWTGCAIKSVSGAYAIARYALTQRQPAPRRAVSPLLGCLGSVSGEDGSKVEPVTTWMSLLSNW